MRWTASARIARLEEIMMSDMTDFVDPHELTKTIRGVLRKGFPNAKISVTTKIRAFSNSVNVLWDAKEASLSDLKSALLKTLPLHENPYAPGCLEADGCDIWFDCRKQ
jgi:hypothetical protein